MATPPDYAQTHERLKREIAEAIKEIMTDFNLSQLETAKRTGLNPSVVSHLVHGHLRYVGLSSLIAAFNRLGGTIDVEITNPGSLPVLDREAR